MNVLDAPGMATLPVTLSLAALHCSDGSIFWGIPVARWPYLRNWGRICFPVDAYLKPTALEVGS